MLTSRIRSRICEGVWGRESGDRGHRAGSNASPRAKRGLRGSVAPGKGVRKEEGKGKA